MHFFDTIETDEKNENKEITDEAVYASQSSVDFGSPTITVEKESLIVNISEVHVHSYIGDPLWVWDESYSVAKAVFICNDATCAHTFTIVCPADTDYSASITNEVTLQPTCLEVGNTTYTASCKFNNVTYTDSKTWEGNVPALGHDLVHYASQAESCTEYGWAAYDTCTRCDYTTYSEIPVLGHDLVHHDAKAPTCTEIGWYAYDTCTRCDHTTYVEIPATGHTHAAAVTENTVAPTCTATGSHDEVVYCSVCNAELSREHVVDEALGHNLVHHDAKAPTCIEFGWHAYDTCSRCDYTTYVERPALGHTPASVVIENVVAPTCTVDGSHDEVVYCSVCGVELNRNKVVDAKLGHDLVHHNTQAPTCTEIGWEAYDTCSRCTYSTYSEIAETGHHHTEFIEFVWNNEHTSATVTLKCSDCDHATSINADMTYTITSVATCVADEVREYKATYEDKAINAVRTETQTVTVLNSAKGHTEVIDAAVVATCTETGLTEGKHCSVCDTVLVAQTTVPATGHTEVTDAAVAATCTETGLTEGKHCSVCNTILVAQTTVPATGHTEVTDVAVAATCTETGLTEGKHCSVCNTVLVAQQVVPATGHDIEHHEAKAATTESVGWNAYDTCSKCDYTTYVEIPMLPSVLFESNFVNTEKYLYRVGNKNSIRLGTLFSAIDGVSIDSSKVTVDFPNENKQGTSASFTANTTTWINGTIQFSGAGAIRVVLKYDGKTQLELNLEVIDAMNAISGDVYNANNYNVCLLSDITTGSGYIEVSNGYGFYGNGFTITNRYNGKAKDHSGMYLGHIQITTGGILDNVILDCGIYPRAYIYKTSGQEYVRESDNFIESVDNKNYYGYQYSGVAISGNSTISNCYIKGARNNILVGSGNVNIINTVCDRGSLSNIQITSSSEYTITLEDVTTIQYLSTDDFGKGVNTEGVGILVGGDGVVSNPKLIINGYLNQHNWVSNYEANNISSSKFAKTIIQTALGKSNYVHSYNGTNYVNMGIIYFNSSTASIEDNRDNHGYVLNTISTFGVSGQVYSPTTGSGSVYVIDSNYEYSPTQNGLYIPSFKLQNLPTARPDEDSFAWNNDNIVEIQFNLGDSYTLDISKYVKYDRYLSDMTSVSASCTIADSVDGLNMTFMTSGTSKIVIQVLHNPVFGVNGEIIGYENYYLNVPVEVITTNSDIPAAKISCSTNSVNMSWGKAGSTFDPDYKQAAPIFDGMIIMDYNADGTSYHVLDGSDQSIFLNSIASIVTDSDKKTGFTINFADGTKLVIKCGKPYHTDGELMYQKYNNKFYLCGTKNYNNATAHTWSVNSYTYTGRNGNSVSYGKRDFVATSSTSTITLSDLKLSDNKFLMFNPQGGDVTPLYSSTSPATLPTPTREGYYFLNWNTNADGTGTARNAGYSMSFSSTTTLYAIWTKNVEVQFIASSEKEIINGGAGQQIKLPSFEDENYWIEGWYTKEYGEGIRIGVPDASIAIPETNAKYYANWVYKLIISFDANGGTVNNSELKYSGVALTLPTPSNGSKTFEGWYTKSEGGERVGSAGDSYTPMGNITLYAQWSNNILVTFNANGGTAGTNSDTYDHVTPILLPSATWAGHQFNGWYTAVSGGTKAGNAGASYTPSEATTLYAQWTAYTVSFDGNGATNPSSLSSGSNGSIALPTPSRTGYTFNGWYTATSGGTKIGNGGASYTPTSNITLHAQWTIKSYKVTITTSNSSTAVTVNGTTVNNGGAVTYNSVVKVVLAYSETDSLTFTIKQGSTNVARYTDANCTSSTSSTNAATYYFKMPAGDVTINSSSTAASSGDSGFCLLPNTLITLADGTQKEIQYLEPGDMLMIFNHETGIIDVAPVTFNEKEEEQLFTVIHLVFDNGANIGVISEHGFFDLDTLRYEYIDEFNYQDFIGHHFYTIDGSQTELVNVYITEELTEVYSLPTFYYLNSFTEGILSMPGGITGLFNIFEYSESLQYDLELMEQDIETYGLFEASDLEELGVDELMFNAYNGQYLKVALGKGILTEEYLMYLIERYGSYTA